MTAAAQISGIGISQVASAFLSLSSILRPLAPQLSNVAMSAGFASFQFGALPGVLALTTAAIAGVRDALMGLASTALDSGFATSRFLDAFINFKSSFNAVLIDLGLTVQEAFAPLLEKLTEVFRGMDLTQIKTVIVVIAEVTELFVDSMLRLGKAIANSFDGLLKTFHSVTGGFFKAFIPPELFDSLRERIEGASSGLVNFNQRGGMSDIASAGSNIQKRANDRTIKMMQDQLTQLEVIARNTSGASTTKKDSVPAVLN